MPERICRTSTACAWCGEPILAGEKFRVSLGLGYRLVAVHPGCEDPLVTAQRERRARGRLPSRKDATA